MQVKLYHNSVHYATHNNIDAFNLHCGRLPYDLVLTIRKAYLYKVADVGYYENWHWEIEPNKTPIKPGMKLLDTIKNRQYIVTDRYELVDLQTGTLIEANRLDLQGEYVEATNYKEIKNV